MARHAKTLALIVEAQAERETEDQLLDQTLQVWQPRAARALTREDARQIVANFTGFFQILSEWRAAELREEEKDLSSFPRALRANISETILVLLINEQGEKEKGRDEREFSGYCFFWRLGCHGTERRRAWRAAAEWSGSPSGRRFGVGLAA